MSLEDVYDDLELNLELTEENELVYNLNTYVKPMIDRAYYAGLSDGKAHALKFGPF